MLASLDQWAFQVLVLFYGLLGINDIPKEPSPDWIVVERWAEQSDQTYRLILESTTIPEKCRQNPDHYVVFPQIYMGRHTIFSDGGIVYSGDPSRIWKIKSPYDKPSIHCSFLSTAEKITFEGDAYLKFFSTINDYPLLQKSGSGLFVDALYIAAIALMLGFGLLGLVFFWKTHTTSELLSGVFQDLSFSLLLYAYVSGYFVRLHIDVLHIFIPIGLWGGFIFFMSIFYSKKDGSKQQFYVALFLIIISCCLFKYKHILQLFIYSPIPVFVLLQLLVIKKVFTDKNGDYVFVEKILLLLVLFFGVMDAYISIVSRDGILHLSFLVTLLSAIRLFKLIKTNRKQVLEAELLKKKIESEKVVINKISNAYEVHRKIIHDIKSPLTSLSFFTKTNDVQKINLVSDHIKSILRKINDENIAGQVDWFSLISFKRIVREAVESNTSLKDIHVIVEDEESDQDDCLIFYDPVELKSIIEELLLNSCKSSRVTVVNLSYSKCEDCVKLIYKDDGVGVMEEDVLKVFGKGYSSGVGGLGLYMVKKRMEAWGGEIVILPNHQHNGFVCELSFLIKA